MFFHEHGQSESVMVKSSSRHMWISSGPSVQEIVGQKAGGEGSKAKQLATNYIKRPPFESIIQYALCCSILNKDAHELSRRSLTRPPIRCSWVAGPAGTAWPASSREAGRSGARARRCARSSAASSSARATRRASSGRPGGVGHERYWSCKRSQKVLGVPFWHRVRETTPLP